MLHVDYLGRSYFQMTVHGSDQIFCRQSFLNSSINWTLTPELQTSISNPNHPDMSSNTDNSATFTFPELRVQPKHHLVTNYDQLCTHLAHELDLYVAFRTTFENSESLLNFLKKWTDRCRNMWTFVCEKTGAKSFPEEEGGKTLRDEIVSLLNIEANMEGCVLLASLFSSFQETYKSTNEKATEDEVIEKFMANVRRLRIYPLHGQPIYCTRVSGKRI
jgi:hypothetical protein